MKTCKVVRKFEVPFLDATQENRLPNSISSHKAVPENEKSVVVVYMSKILPLLSITFCLAQG